MKKLVGVVFIIALVMTAGYFLYGVHERSEREQHIFCETLVPGMSGEEVLDHLRQFGDFNHTTPLYFDGAYNEVALGYEDLQLVGQKTYILSFQNGKYSGVSVIPGFWEFRGIGTVKAVCEE
jgi:hypothetical protein